MNHNGSVEVAKEMVDKAKKAGADCIRFQTFVTKNVVAINAEKAEYRKQLLASLYYKIDFKKIDFKST